MKRTWSQWWWNEDDKKSRLDIGRESGMMERWYYNMLNFKIYFKFLKYKIGFVVCNQTDSWIQFFLNYPINIKTCNWCVNGCRVFLSETCYDWSIITIIWHQNQFQSWWWSKNGKLFSVTFSIRINRCVVVLSTETEYALDNWSFHFYRPEVNASLNEVQWYW